ncbi:fimbrial protein [Frateuria defendens]|uniref:fimbrial protein n=1 Tax=Frateuria defendens TaxID=2219559 RepID=UPI00066FE9CE|nr:fimbrial protein [Frateuria defendens]
MRPSRLLLSLLVLLCGAMAWPQAARANCWVVTNGVIPNGSSAQLKFGNVNLASAYLQPVHTLLATATASASGFTGWSDETVIWRCLKSDADALYLLVATNGDDRVGGYWYDQDDNRYIFATQFRYVGIRQTMAGVEVTRWYNKVPLNGYDVVGDLIEIKAKHIPPLVGELYRISWLPPESGAPGCWCGCTNGSLIAQGNYGCLEPTAYVQLVGPGITHDNVGDDSARQFVFWGAGNGVAYGMRNATYLVHNNTCVVRNVTPVVYFPVISTSELNQGGTRQANFTIQLECDDSGVRSGIGWGDTSLGIQASPGAYNSAKKLGLVNASNGVDYLVSDSYGIDASVATGVGIKLSNDSTDSMRLLGWPLAAGTGNAGGWYPVLEGASAGSSQAAGYLDYSRTITATLTRLPGLTPTPGKVYATASIIVKLQ